VTSRTRRSCLLALLAAATACASGAGPETGPLRRSGDADRLTRDDVMATHTSDAFEAIRVLRPNWLRKRGQMSVTQDSDIQVYLDHVQLGGVEMLRSIPVSTVGSVQFLDAASATQRWGTGHVHGAILVTTMSSRTPDVASAPRGTHIGGAAAARGALGG